MGDARGRDVPALPAGPRRAVRKVDVLAVEAEALVEPAELVQHGAPKQQEGAEHPVRLDRLVRLVAVEVRLRREDAAQWSPPDDRPGHGREAPARRLSRSIAIQELRRDDARP